MTKTEFIDSCVEQLLRVYQQIKAGYPDDKLKYRAEGFIHAGRKLDLISEEEALKMMEQAHIDVFGETIALRQARKASLQALKQRAPDQYFEIPAIERRR